MLSIAKPLPSQKFLAECFDYNPETGSVVWKERPLEHFRNREVWKSWNRKYAGKVVGFKNAKGYLKVSINHQKYFLHRILWKLVTGNEPIAQIDHKDGGTSTNQWENLREATPAQNQQNKRKHPANQWGYKGVEWKARDKRFRARFYINGKRRTFGSFATPYEAHLAYIELANKYQGEFAAQRIPAPPPT